MKPSPKIRKDGLCFWCEGPRLTKQKHHRWDPSLDPFCSTACCRAYHGVPLEGSSPPAVEKAP